MHAMDGCNLMAELDNTFKAAKEEIVDNGLEDKEIEDAEIDGLEDEVIEDAEMDEMEMDEVEMGEEEMGEEEMGEGIGVHPLVLGGGGGPHGGAGGGACGSSASSSADAFVVFWTNAEDDIIKNSVAELGNQWSLIASRLPGRTADTIRKRHEHIRHRNTRIIQGSGVHTPAIGGVGGICGPHGGAGGTEDIDDSLVSTVTSTVASISHQPSATSHQPSATSHQPSAISQELQSWGPRLLQVIANYCLPETFRVHSGSRWAYCWKWMYHRPVHHTAGEAPSELQPRS